MKVLKFFGRLLLVFAIMLAAVIAVVLLFLSFYPSVGNVPDKQKQNEYAQKTDLYYDKQFHNEDENDTAAEPPSKESDRSTPKERIPVERIDSIERAGKDELKVTWLGHSSTLVQMGDKNILIDPIFSERTSPVGFAGPKRFSDIALDADTVPEIDVLFISHDHYDHLDYQTIKAIDSKVSRYVTPLGVDAVLKGWGVDEGKLCPLSWWEDTEIDGITYTLTPSKHYSGRNPLKRNATLWGGLYIKNGIHSLYYTGDGSYYDVFEKVYERFGETELMLVENGQYDVGWPNSHMFPEQSVRAVKDAHAGWAIPVHWGAVKLSNHAWDDPPRLALEEAERLGVNLATPRIGQTVDFDDISDYTERWWKEYR